MTVSCTAKTTLWHPGFRKIYSCNIFKSDLRAQNGQTKITFEMVHNESGKTDKDVEAVVILDTKLHKIPQNFQQIFVNLSVLCIKQCNLTRIERKDLANFSNLRELWMPNNKLLELPGNLFVDHPKIEKISFSNNKISIIGPQLLDPLGSLKYANFNRNLSIDITFDAEDPTISLEHLKNIIVHNCKGLNHSAVRIRKRNLSFIRNIESPQSYDISSLASGDTCTISSIPNISCNTSSSYNVQIVQSHQFFSSGSLNSQQSFQRVQYVARRRHKTTKIKTVHQETQTERKTFVEDINKFLFVETFKDFAIKNEKRTFNVHRFVMAARCPVVCKMIERNPEMKGIELTHTNDQTIENLLDFIYEDQLPEFERVRDVLQMFDLSMKLQLKELTEYSRNQILTKANSENAIECLEVAAKHNDKALKATGLELIQEMFPGKKFKTNLIDNAEELTKMIGELKIMKKKIKEATLKFNELSFFEKK